MKISMKVIAAVPSAKATGTPRNISNSVNAAYNNAIVVTLMPPLAARMGAISMTITWRFPVRI